MDKEQKQTDELQKFKDDLSKFDKEQLVEMLVTYSILNSQLTNQNKLQHVDFLNAIKEMTNSTEISLQNIVDSIQTVFKSSKILQTENKWLWVAVVAQALFIGLLLIIK